MSVLFILKYPQKTYMVPGPDQSLKYFLDKQQTSWHRLMLTESINLTNGEYQNWVLEADDVLAA